eukprot:136722-Pelagomonas_calceolata.AAC.2
MQMSTVLTPTTTFLTSHAPGVQHILVLKQVEFAARVAAGSQGVRFFPVVAHYPALGVLTQHAWLPSLACRCDNVLQQLVCSAAELLMRG